MRKLGKLWVKKVWAQLNNPVTNSFTKLDFHVDVYVNVYVDVDVCHHIGHHVHLNVGHLVYLNVGHLVHLHVGHHNVVSMLCGSETLTEWKPESITNLPTDIGVRC